MSLITFGTTPHPDGWLEHSPRPEMKGKRLGVLAHTWFKPENGDQLAPIFGTDRGKVLRGDGAGGDFVAGDATVVLPFRSADAAASGLASDYVGSIMADNGCNAASAMRSLNDPDYSVVAQRWSGCSEVGCNLEDHPARKPYANAAAKLSDDGT